MQKKYIILITVISVLIVGVFGVFYYLSLQKTSTGETPTLREFIPFLNNNTNNPTTPQTSNTGFIDGEQQINSDVLQTPSAEKLRQIVDYPIAGYAVIEKDRIRTNLDGSSVIESAPAVRYAEKASGNIYETYADNIKEVRISGTNIPKVEDAVFSDQGNSVVLRYVRDDKRTIESFFGQIKKEVPGGDSSIELKGSFLNQNITGISASPDMKSLFYMFEIGNGVVGIKSSGDGSRKSQIFDSSFSEWLINWPSPNIITFNTKAAASADGFLYALNPENRSFKKILGNIRGLTTLLSPDGKLVLYSDNTLSLKVFNIENGSSADLGIRTLPEKCVWSNNNENVFCATPIFPSVAEYPDVWYQGIISFNDSFWKVNVKNNTSSIVENESGANISAIDGIKLMLDTKEKNLFFINKKDSTLWSLNLN